MDDATPTADPLTLARLRSRLANLDRRSAAALRRAERSADVVTRRRLEAMRFELAAAAWRLAELEAGL